MGKKAPAAPDPNVTAAAQSGMNRDTAITNQQLNMIDQYNPYGSVTYSPNGFDTFVDSKGNTVQTPKYSQTTTFSPEQQALYETGNVTAQNLADLAADQSGFLKDYMSTPFEFTNGDAEKWAYDIASPTILGTHKQAEDALRTTLANKGIREGSAAWSNEMNRLFGSTGQQLNQLALQGRGQAFSENLATRNQPINEITALMSGSQVQNPTAGMPATPQTSVAGVDYTGLVNQNYQNQLGAYQSKMGGIGGLFGTALGAMGTGGALAQGGALSGLMAFSDQRLKENIRRVGQTDGGIPLYAYNFKGNDAPQIGVMAQELQAIKPDAVHQHESGYLMVDYSEVK